MVLAESEVSLAENFPWEVLEIGSGFYGVSGKTSEITCL